MPFANREAAGRQLASRLLSMGLESPVVLGLARGGVPVAAEIAAALGVAFDAFVARKLGMPGQEELGIGAVAEGLEEPVLSALVGELAISGQDLQAAVNSTRDEVDRRVLVYRGTRPLPEITDRDVVLVDDGLATGVTAEAALRSLRSAGPRRLAHAIPVCDSETAGRLTDVADRIICVEAREGDFVAVGLWYEDFSQITDQDVLDLLDKGASLARRS